MRDGGGAPDTPACPVRSSRSSLSLRRQRWNDVGTPSQRWPVACTSDGMPHDICPDISHNTTGALASCNRFMATLPRDLKAPRCDIHAIAVSLAAEMSARHGARFHVEGEGVMTGVWSPASMRSILEQLLANAVLHGDPRANITMRIRRREGRLLLAVHNEGAAMSPQRQAQLFEPLGRASEPRWDNGRGGLALVRSLVEAHGGVMTLTSHHSAGTTFAVDLPIDGRAA